MTNFNDVVSQFRIEGTVESVSPIGNGLINETLRVKTVDANTPDYILHYLFVRPKEMSFLKVGDFSIKNKTLTLSR